MLKVKVEDLMTESVIKISQDATIMQAAHLLLRHQINGLLVSEEKGSDNIVGVLTTTDLLGLVHQALSSSIHRMTELDKLGKLFVKDVMGKEILRVQKDAKLARAISIMHKQNKHTIPVYDGDTLVGVIGRHDVLNAAFYPDSSNSGE